MKQSLGLARMAIERILELSAEAQCAIRKTATDSPEFHMLTGAISAYGKALALLAALQRREEHPMPSLANRNRATWRTQKSFQALRK